MNDDTLPQGDLGFFCEEIAREFKARGVLIRNTKTGREVHTASDVYNFSSTGELFHIWEWYPNLFPDRVTWPDGELHREPVSQQEESK